jgi:hypothetical protein
VLAEGAVRSNASLSFEAVLRGGRQADRLPLATATVGECARGGVGEWPGPGARVSDSEPPQNLKGTRQIGFVYQQSPVVAVTLRIDSFFVQLFQDFSDAIG